MPPRLDGLLRSQSTHSAVILLAILFLAARAAGVDVPGITTGMAEFLTGLGGVSAAAKILLPDAPPPPPPPSPPADGLSGRGA